MTLDGLLLYPDIKDLVIKTNVKNCLINCYFSINVILPCFGNVCDRHTCKLKDKKYLLGANTRKRKILYYRWNIPGKPFKMATSCH